MLRKIGLLFTAVFSAILISACSVADQPLPTVGFTVTPAMSVPIAVDSVFRIDFDKDVDFRYEHVRLLEVPMNAPATEVEFELVTETPRRTFALDPVEDLSFATRYRLEFDYSLNGTRFDGGVFEFDTAPRQTAQVIVTRTDFVYNARPREVSVATVPVGLPHRVEYYQDDEVLAGPPVDAGTYDVVVTVTSNEYVGEARAVLVIDPLQINVTGYRAESKVYDGTDVVFVSGTPTLVGTLDRDVYIETARFWFNTVNVGTGISVRSSFVLEGSRSDNYIVTSPVLTANITPATAYIIPRPNQTRVYGEQDPILLYDVDGLVVQTDRVTGTLARASGEDVGFYPFTLGTLTAGTNYVLSLAAPETRFEITRRQVVVTPREGQTAEYLDADPVLRYTVTGLVFDDELAGALSREPGIAIGEYLITLGTLRAVDGEGNFSNNYTLTLTPETYFSITLRTVVVTPVAGQLKRVGEADPVFSWTVTPAPLDADWGLILGQIAREPGELACVEEDPLVLADEQVADCYDYLIGTLTFPEYYDVQFETLGRQFYILPAQQ